MEKYTGKGSVFEQKSTSEASLICFETQQANRVDKYY